jgi:hypothetical protein
MNRTAFATQMVRFVPHRTLLHYLRSKLDGSVKLHVPMLDFGIPAEMTLI